MSLFDRIRNALRGESGPRLRNKPGGLAMIKVPGDRSGAEQLTGCIVKTVRVNEYGTGWLIDPPQQFTATRDIVSFRPIHTYPKGQTVTMGGLEDEYLEPLREVGDDERDESTAWLPPVETTKAGEVKA